MSKRAGSRYKNHRDRRLSRMAARLQTEAEAPILNHAPSDAEAVGSDKENPTNNTMSIEERK